MGRFSIVEADTDPAVFAEALAAEGFAERTLHPVYGDFARTYYPVVFGDALAEASFAVTEGERPVGLVQCSVMDGVLSHYGFPIRFFLDQGLTPGERRKCVSAAFRHIEEMAEGSGFATARVSGGLGNGFLSPVDQACLDRAGRPEVRIRAEADLSLDEDALRRDVRDSYRSLINRGRRDLELAYVNPDNPDPRMFDDYRLFHARVAGREVHGKAVWSTMFDHIAEGGGELCMGYAEDGELVAGTMVMEEPDTTLYFSAVYDRERFDKPIGHWPLFDAMIRAKGRGRRHFDLGEVFPRGTVSAKEFNIGFFKKGFTSRQVAETVWTVPFAEGGQPASDQDLAIR